MNADWRVLLEAIVEAEAEVESRPEPDAWKRWAAAELETLRAHGPVYDVAAWLNGGEELPPRVRVRMLRAIHKMADAGLVELTFGESGTRLRHVRTTAAGREALDKLQPAPELATA